MSFPRKRSVIILVLTILTIVAVAWGPIVSNVEQSKYTVVESSGDIEIRDYDPRILAEVQVSGDRKEAINNGFKLLADYIFGNNTAQSKISMTAPVTQQTSEKIAMTAPVTQEGIDGKWQVRFMMPSNYDLNTLPKPNNEAIKLETIPAKRYAVIRFSGTASDADLAAYTEKLQEYLRSSKLEQISEPIYAFFNPPWTLPFLRRNEVMIEIPMEY